MKLIPHHYFTSKATTDI